MDCAINAGKRKNYNRESRVQILENHKTTRVTAGRFFAVVITLALLLSVAFLVKEADHTCTGSECPICAMMEQCSHTIRLLGAGVLLGFLCTFLSAAFLWSEPKSRQNFLVYSSLVTQNIRMND